MVCGALVAWARATADLVRIPAVHSPWFGLALLLAGAIITLAGASLFPHPVYTGFCIICAGVSIASGSASGLWLVSPVVTLSCAALVLSYERRDSLLPESGASPPTSPPTDNDRLRFYLFVLLPWLALYEVVLAIGMPPDAISGMSRFEQRLPVLEWSQIIYASTYILTLLAPVFAKTRSDLRSYSVRAWWTMLVAYPAFLLIPLIAPKRPFTPHTLPGRVLLWERTLDSPVAAFPSFHVIWAMLAAEVFARRWPRLKGLFYGWAILVAASCVTTSQHSILDVLGGAATVALVVHGPQLWAAVRGHAERGPRRVMSRGLYAGVAAFLGLWLAETMAGTDAQTISFVAGGAVIVAAAIWAQSAERPSRLLRPIGICGLLGGFLVGGLSGGTAGALLRPMSGTGTWLIVAALAVGTPLAQAVDRLRCVHPRSRAYSMCWSMAIALILTRLWLLAAPLHLIAGLYFILAGLGRFVEEAWHGEPRSQWAAVASVIAGVLITALGRSAPAPNPHFTWSTLLPAVVFGVIVAIVAGVDFPNSNRRFHESHLSF